MRYRNACRSSDQAVTRSNVTNPPRHRGDSAVIRNDQELKAAQERIAYFQQLLAQFRVTSDPDEFPLVASGYRTELEKMQRQVLDYLTRHASQTVPAEVA
jgi:hypothetical protein